MTRHKLSVITAAIIIGLGILFFPKGLKRILGHDISISQDNGQGAISINYTGHAQEINYINVAVDLNDDGRIGVIQVNGRAVDEWVIVNKVVEAEKGKRDTFEFPLDDQFNQSARKVNVLLSHVQLAGDAWSAKLADDIEVSKTTVRIVSEK